MSQSSSALLAALAGGAVGGALIALVSRHRQRGDSLESRLARLERARDAPPEGPPRPAPLRRSSDSVVLTRDGGGDGEWPERSWCAPRRDKCGVIGDLTLEATLPYVMAIGGHAPSAGVVQGPEHGVRTGELYRSATVTRAVHARLRATALSGVPSVTHGDVVDLCLQKGGTRVYVYGGFLRDLVVGATVDDMDFLFRSSGGSVVPYLERLGEARGWAPYRKRDERNGVERWDFISLGDRAEADGGRKFTGHPLYAGCEGEFACNSLLYDVASGVLIDPTGVGRLDAANCSLRIPYPESQWHDWLEHDRLTGMKLFRYAPRGPRPRSRRRLIVALLPRRSRASRSYFNFCSRGFTPIDDGDSSRLRAFVAGHFVRLFAADDPALKGRPPTKKKAKGIRKTAKVFFERKVFRGAPEGHAARERTYRATVLRELTGARAESMAGFARGDAAAADDGALPCFDGDEARALAWYVEFVVPCYPPDHAPLDGLPDATWA